jgi:hypothetical protein
VSIVIEIDGMTWTIDVLALLGWLLIGALALGAVLVLLVQVQATLKGGPDRRRFREQMAEVNRKAQERKARAREAESTVAEPPQAPVDHDAQLMKRRRAVERARGRRLKAEGWGRAGFLPQGTIYIAPSRRNDAPREGEIQHRDAHEK